MKKIIDFMKKNYLAIAFTILLGAVLWSFMPNKEQPKPQKEANLMSLLMYVLNNAHYAPTAINDSLSEEVFDKFIEITDPNKRFFLQSDIEEFKMYRDLIDNEIENKSFDFFTLVYNRLNQRTKESEKIYKELLDKPFDYTIDEKIDTDSEKLDFPANEAERKDRWRKQLKFSVLSSVVNKEENQSKEKKKDEHKEETADNKEQEAPKTFEELEAEARKNSLNSLNNFFEMFEEISREEWFAIYVNTILEQFDPHTNYFSPDNKEKFDESMSGSMEGIGAQLTKKDDYVKITRIIPGGPAWKQKELENDDLILKVGQEGEEPKDIAGLRLDKVVKMIKGKKGTTVYLTVKKIDGTIKEISIVRDEFELDETFAKSSILKTDQGTFGMISLPKFYEDFQNKDQRDAYIDVKHEVEALKKAGVQGIIMDLRNNGGGSLRAVVKMVGLFIDEGPVVQVRSANGVTKILNDEDPAVQWDGPLVVMIDNYSASASEIFAAAIQDYNRGVIIGSKHSFGKGTVQNMIDLNNIIRMKNDDDYGALKFTVQKFYRINGGSTQLKGVESDIVMPDQYSYIETGEKDYQKAMHWDKIKEANYKKLPYNFAPIIGKSRQRIKASATFQLADENAKWINETKDQSVYPLKYDLYKKEADKIEKIADKFKALKEYNNHIQYESLPEEQKQFANDTLLRDKRQRWHESLLKDYYLEEAVHVLEDMKNAHD